MKLKAALKYQIHGMIKPLIIFYIIIYAIIIFAGIQRVVMSHNGIRVTSSGVEISTAIFIFVFGLNSFKSTFHLFLANGVSRKTMFKSYILAVVPLAVFMALIDTINNLALSSVGSFQSIFYQMYHMHYGPILNFSAQMRVALDGFVWMTFLYTALSLIGFFITTIYYRMGKSLKLIVSIGVPVFFLMLLPYMDTYLFDGKIFDALRYFLAKAWGFLDGYNPYISVLTCFITAAVFGALSFLAMRRATVKK
jgi:hypothetical protein